MKFLLGGSSTGLKRWCWGIFSKRRLFTAARVAIAQMTEEELREIIETIIEQKLLEFLGEPDEGLPIRQAVLERLLRQKQAVADGERGESLEAVVQRLGLE